jgi:thiol-disulfide isomerase/thioredoxin
VKTIVSIASLLALIVVAGGAMAVARHTDPERVVGSADVTTPADLPVLAASSPPVDATGWLNTTPLTPDDLAGKVVLYDFWTYSCINCQHTLPYVKAWYERYARDGLVVLSVHSPEFDYEAEPANVASFVKSNQIAFPVALDPHHTVWRAFDNHYWPAFYVQDRAGAQRYVHFGEGRYDETEDVLRVLLGVDPASPRAQAKAP